MTPTTQPPALCGPVVEMPILPAPLCTGQLSYSSCMAQVKGHFLQEVFSDGPSSHQAQESSINPGPPDFVVANPSLLFLLLSYAFLGAGSCLLISSFLCVCECELAQSLSDV